MGYLFALMATLFWSGNAIAARFLAESVPPVGVSFWRWAVALAVCAPFTYPAFRKNISEIKKHWKYLTLAAFLGVALFNTILYTAAHTTTAFNIAVISTFTPVIILIFSVIFAGEKVSRVNLAGFVTAFAGIINLVSDGRPFNILKIETAAGDYLMLFASCVFASYTVLVRKKPYSININAMIFFTFAAGFAMLSVPYVIQELFFTGVHFGRAQIGGFLYIGIFASFASFMFWNRAVVMIGAAKSGAVYYSIPVFTGFLGFFLLGEAVTLTDVLSMIMVGFGVYLTGRK